MQVVKYDQVQGKIIEVRDQKVIIDSDVAELYGVETKRVNEAVKNNPDKFPDGYLIELNNEEKIQLVENFDESTQNRGVKQLLFLDTSGKTIALAPDLAF